MHPAGLLVLLFSSGAVIQVPPFNSVVLLFLVDAGSFDSDVGRDDCVCEFDSKGGSEE